MRKPLVSKRTISALLELASIFFVLNTIRQAFEMADVAGDPFHESECSGQRRQLADRYVASLDLTEPRDIRRLLAVIQHMLGEIEITSGDGALDLPDVKRLLNGLKADGYAYRDGQIVAQGATSALGILNVVAEHIDAEYIRNQVRRLEASVETDPEAAIGGAKELIESVCKTVLADHGVADLDAMDVPKLIKAAQGALKLTPEDVPETARGKDSVKRLMGSLSAIAVSVAELRNEYGTGHGKEGRAKRPKARHARLAVGCAATLATFLLETHVLKEGSEQKPRSPTLN